MKQRKINVFVLAWFILSIAVTLTAETTSPALSQEEVTRVVGFLDKTSKLKAITSDQIALPQFKAQLTEIKASWDNLKMLGWPRQLQTAIPPLDHAVVAWDVANDIWSEQEALQKGSAADVLFVLRAGKKYGDRLEKVFAAAPSGSIQSPPFVRDKASLAVFQACVLIRFADFSHRYFAEIDQAPGRETLHLLQGRFEEDSSNIKSCIKEVLGFNAPFLLDAVGQAPKASQAEQRQSGPIDGAVGACVPDNAIRWCFAAAAASVDDAKRKIQSVVSP